MSGNSQYWRTTEEPARRERYEVWLKAEFAAAKTAGEPVILASHMSPFVASLGEAGVKFYLAGHTHRMIARADSGITILNAETTCRNFDGRPTGYRRLEISPDGDYTWTFRRICTETQSGENA